MNKKLWAISLILPCFLFIAVAYYKSTGSENIPLLVTVSSDSDWDNSAPPFALSPDNRFVATICMINDAFFQIVEFDRKAEGDGTRNLPHADRYPMPNFISFTPDGNRLITTGVGNPQNGFIQIWNLKTGKAPQKLAKGQVRGDVALSRDGKTLVYFGEESRIVFLDIDSGKTIGSITSQQGAQAISLALSPDGKQLAATYRHDRDSSVVLFDSTTKKEIWSRSFRPKREYDSICVVEVTFSPDGKTLAIVVTSIPEAASYLAFLDTRDGQGFRKITKATLHGGYRASIDFSPDGKLIACGGPQVDLWNVSDGSHRSKLDGTGDVKFSSDGNFLMSHSMDIVEPTPESITYDVTDDGSHYRSRKRSLILWKRF